MLVFPFEHNFDLVQRVMDCMESFGLVSGLRMNPNRTQWMCKNDWTSMGLLMYDLGFRQYDRETKLRTGKFHCFNNCTLCKPDKPSDDAIFAR